jgi:transcriptional regulator with XRE-family HTH domain
MTQKCHIFVATHPVAVRVPLHRTFKNYSTMNETANRIKELRSRRGYSQEELAERSGLSLRTIQRIENNETEPRGDTLTRLAAALDVTVEELADWGLVEDNRFIMAMNLSALSFLFNPVLGVVVPLIVWLFKKDRIKGLNDAARSLLNFQITWALIYGAIFLFTAYTITYTIERVGDVSPSSITTVTRKAAIYYLFQAFNLIMILVNSARAARGKRARYVPAIPFIGK